MATKLALLSGAVPSKCLQGPVTRIPVGDWSIRVFGLISSKLILHPFGPISTTALLSLKEPTEFQIQFEERGNEEYITVIAESAA